MSVWRRKALESFPELAPQLTDADVDSTYAAWREVFLPLVGQAFAGNDEALVARILDYAAWSARQPTKQVWNAVYVGFYEELFDVSRSDEWMARLGELIPADVVQNAWPLWEDRLSDSELARLRTHVRTRP